MLKKSLCAHVLAIAAGTMMLVPAMPVQAAPQAASQVRSGADVVLVKGELNGNLLTANGKAIEGAPVVVSKNGKEVARTVTKADGSYTIKGLTAGAHTVSLEGTPISVRLWSKEAAPATAKTNLTLARSAVRGQDDGYTYFDPITGLVIVSVVGFGIYNAVKINDLEDQIDELTSP